MPYPSQVSSERILEKARNLLEFAGINEFSLHGLAAALGVKTPSLYRYYASKNELLRALNLQTVHQLTTWVRESTLQVVDPHQQLLDLASTWHTFSQAYPHTYQLAFSNSDPELRPDERLLESLAIPLQQVMAKLSGPDESLTALRGLWALIHGFILLELSGQFRRGGDLDDAFIQSVDAYLSGWNPAKK